MHHTQLRGFREKLLEKKREILEAYFKTRSYGQEAEPEGQDLADRASSSYAKEFLFSLSSAERNLLRLVDEALERLDRKRFGRCLVCGEGMNPKRLLAVPWTPHCLRCQELQEQGLL
jgi:DnaK suppressor protein